MDPHEQLLAAVLLRAWRDAQSNRPKLREPAIAWLRGPGGENACTWLGLPVDVLRRRL